MPASGVTAHIRAPSHISNIAPYLPGKPISELAREMQLNVANIVKLASNENPLGISPKARAAMLTEINNLARYPDSNGYELKQAIATKFSTPAQPITPAQIVLGNGSNDILDLVARTFLTTADSVVYAQYAFVVYPLATQSIGAQGIEVPAASYGHDLAAMRKAIRPNTKLVFIANPNNPTGTLCPYADIVAFLEQCPANVLVVLDEAYTEYLGGESLADSFALLSRFPNLLISRTLSKAYGLAGMRIGFSVSAPAVAEMMNRVRQPFNVNSLAQIAAIATLNDELFLQKTVRNNADGMKQLTDAFQQMGIAYIPSHGNFVTIHVRDGMALNQFMLKNGVIIRPLANYGLPNSLRISIGLPAENARFIAVLKEAQTQKLLS